MNTQFTCEPEVSGPAPRSVPARRSTSIHYSNLASPYCIRAPNLLRRQPGEKTPVQRPAPIIRYPSISLAAAAVAALRLLRRLTQVLCRIVIELLFALGAAKEIGLSCVIGVSSGISCFYVHAAYGIFHNCCAAHMGLLGFVNLGRLRLSD